MANKHLQFTSNIEGCISHPETGRDAARGGVERDHIYLILEPGVESGKGTALVVREIVGQVSPCFLVDLVQEYHVCFYVLV